MCLKGGAIADFKSICLKGGGTTPANFKTHLFKVWRIRQFKDIFVLKSGAHANLNIQLVEGLDAPELNMHVSETCVYMYWECLGHRHVQYTC